LPGRDPAGRRRGLRTPAVPYEARQVAIEKAQAGEQITVASAKEIVAGARKMAG
jgi:hypothetical protein